jgi:hypothetical protein
MPETPAQRRLQERLRNKAETAILAYILKSNPTLSREEALRKVGRIIEEIQPITKDEKASSDTHHDIPHLSRVPLPEILERFGGKWWRLSDGKVPTSMRLTHAGYTMREDQSGAELACVATMHEAPTYLYLHSPEFCFEFNTAYPPDAKEADDANA